MIENVVKEPLSGVKGGLGSSIMDVEKEMVNNLSLKVVGTYSFSKNWRKLGDWESKLSCIFFSQLWLCCLSRVHSCYVNVVVILVILDSEFSFLYVLSHSIPSHLSLFHSLMHLRAHLQSNKPKYAICYHGGHVVNLLENCYSLPSFLYCLFLTQWAPM